jgi:hypothetical protein
MCLWAWLCATLAAVIDIAMRHHGAPASPPFCHAPAGHNWRLIALPPQQSPLLQLRQCGIKPHCMGDGGTGLSHPLHSVRLCRREAAAIGLKFQAESAPLMNRDDVGHARNGALTARSTIAKVPASIPGAIRMVALPITISIASDPLSCAGAMATCVLGCAASTITGVNTGLLARPPAAGPQPHPGAIQTAAAE